MAVKRVQNSDIIEMNERYAQCKNKSQVARELGFSPSTVAKYLIPGYIKKEDKMIIKFDSSMIGAPSARFLETDDFGSLCPFSDEEEKEMKEFWKELLV